MKPTPESALEAFKRKLIISKLIMRFQWKINHPRSASCCTTWPGFSNGGSSRTRGGTGLTRSLAAIPLVLLLRRAETADDHAMVME